MINTFSKINVKDGVLTLKKQFIPSANNPKKGWNGYVITGEGLNYQSQSPVFVTNGTIYPYNSKTNTISKYGAGF